MDNGISFYDLVRKFEEYNDKAENDDRHLGQYGYEGSPRQLPKGRSFPLRGKELDLSMGTNAFRDENQTGLWKAVEEYGKKGPENITVHWTTP